MRFKVFGGADCTDMFLAQMVPVTPLSVAELQDLASKAVALTVANNNATLQQEIMDQLVASYQSSSSGVNSSGSNSSSTSSTSLGLACCALHTLITNIVIFDVDSEHAARELHVLGLEPAAAKALVEIATAGRAQILAAAAEAVRMAPNVARAHVQAQRPAERDRVVVTATNRKHRRAAADEDDGPPELGGATGGGGGASGDGGMANAKDNEDDTSDPTTYVVTLDKRSDSASSSSASSRNVLSFTADAATLKSLLSELIVAREAM